MLCLATTAGRAAPLTLADALQRTLADSPTLAAYPFSLRAADARALQAGLRPNPTLGLEVENIGGSDELSGIDSAEVTLALSQLIELGDKRQHRRDVAQWERRALGVDYELARIETLGETARRYVEAARAQQSLALARQQIVVAERALIAARKRAAAGAAPDAEVKRLDIALMRAEIVERQAAGQAEIARIRLAGLWGGLPDFESVQAEALSSYPRLVDELTLIERLMASPALERWTTRERLREAQLRLAESRAVPDVEIGMGVRHLSAVSENALVLSFSMPLQLFDRNQGGIVAANAEVEVASRERLAALVELEALLRTLYRQLSIYRAEAEQIRTAALPAARDVLEEIERGYRAGRFSVLELIAAQEERLDLEAAAIAAEAAFHLQLIELERLTGQPLTAAGRSDAPARMDSQ